ncbi:unnamed protein product [Linum tenue]|uniref:Uncharacterized protein n=1 Tax=Linum tenue TaxID=586396 RepID=A0AAV0NNV6_9ROSI|nr:unnamed protein product [Linum tenue]
MAKRKKSTNPLQTTAPAGRSQDKGPPRSSKAMLKLDHLQRLAVWAGGEASIPSLGAFFGRQFATAAEALGVPPDPSLFSCQRCESVLQPGFNCTIRIEKNRRKAAKRRGKNKTNHIPPQNYVIYTCHFCSFRNQKRGTSKGHVKSICPPKPKPNTRSTKSDASAINPITPVKEATTSRKKVGEAMKVDDILPAIPEDIPVAAGSPRTPLDTSDGPIPLLEALKKKRNRSKTKKKPEESESGSAAAAASTDPETSAGGSRKRRKSWTSWKEIIGNNE